MQAITTKYLGATSTKPSRIKASCRAGSIVITWDYSFDVEYNHARAAMSLARKLGWTSSDENRYREEWECGELRVGYAFVMRGMSTYHSESVLA